MCCRCTAALVACLLLAAAQRVAPFPDVNTADGLAAVIAARSAVVGSTRQLVLYSHTSYGGSSAPLWRAFAVELAASLDRVGHGNHIALAGSAAACADLPPAMYCAYDSLLAHHSATRPGVESLWVLRFHAATLLSLAGVGVTVLDTDCVVTRPFLPVLASLERKYALVVLREGPANGGTWHLRASPPHSAALWVIRQVERVTLLFAAAMAHAAAANASAGLQDPGLAMDQDVLARAIRVATTPGGSAFDWWEAYVKSAHKDHELWLQHPQEAPSRPTELWTDADLAGLAQQWPPPEDDGSEPPEQRARRAALRARLGAQTATQVVIRTPFDDEAYDEEGGDSGELLLQAPDWLWAHGDALEAGFASEVGVYHLLFTNKAFTPPRVGAHVGRWAAWLARPGMPSVPPLDPARPLLAANQRLVDAAAAAGFAQLRALLGMLATRAGLAGRTPVLPRLSCAQAWIAQDNTTQAGYRDHKVVDDGVWCYPSPPIPKGDPFDCLPTVHYEYAFRVPEHSLQLQTATVLHDHNDAADEAARATSPGLAQLQKACPGFFES